MKIRGTPAMDRTMNEIKILFCCRGNLCRSPMAEGLVRALAEQAGLGPRIVVDSAGTHVDFPNSPPDPRAQRVMARRGIDISGSRSRRITDSDFRRFDLILAMDGWNHDVLRFICPKPHAHKLGQLLEHAPRLGITAVPDPFHADEAAFESVLQIIEAAANGLLEHLRTSLESMENF